MMIKLYFLHKVNPGRADHSYGIQVAQMAGLPIFVTNRAKEVLDNLESKELTPYEIKKERLRKLKSENDNQISLFEFKDDELRTEINKMELDKITPLEALNKLNELKKKMKKIIKKYYLFLTLVLLLLSCRDQENVVTLDEQYVNDLKKERESKDWEMKDDTHSPFNVDSSAKFEPLKYYEPTSEFIFKSKLYINNKQDTIKIFGTRGEERKAIIDRLCFTKV